MGIGALCLTVRQSLKHGLRVAYWRDVVRPRILQTRPISGNTDGTCEIHALTSADDWLNLIWALKSFYHASSRNYRLCMHDDGSLTESQRNILKQHFPDSRLIERPRADLEVGQVLPGFPRSLQLRTTNILSMKVFDFRHFLSSDRMLLLDSDILFFDRPVELLRRIDDPACQCNAVNRDVQDAYTVEADAVWQQCHVRLVSRFNSGLGLIHRDSMRLEWIEEFLALPGIVGHFWRIEQTLFALCSSRHGVDLLPAEYDVALQENPIERPCRHYVGAIRPRLYGDGVRQLCRMGFLDQMSGMSP